MKRHYVLILIFTGLCTGLPCCKFEKSKTGDSEQKDSNLEMIDISDWKSEINEDLLFLIPTPGEIIERFYEADIQYKPDMVNSVDHLDDYLDSRSQALNLGVYIADLAYSAKFGRLGECIDYLEAIKSLGTQVGVSSRIFESLLTRAKENINIVDSLVYISNEAFLQMFNFFEISKKENTLAIVSTGAYIESLYLVLQFVEEYSENDPVIQQLSELKYPFDNLLSRSSMYEDDTNVKNIIIYLNQIKEIFDQLVSEETELVVTEKDKGKLFISGGEQLIISEQDYLKMKKEILAIRNGITGI